MSEQPRTTPSKQIGGIFTDLGHAIMELVRSGQEAASHKLEGLVKRAGEDANGLPEVPHIKQDDLT